MAERGHHVELLELGQDLSEARVAGLREAAVARVRIPLTHLRG
jgi:hypothetical protein